MCFTLILTFVYKLVVAEEAPMCSHPVGLKDELDALVDRYERLRSHCAAQTILQLFCVTHVNCKHVNVVEQTPAPKKQPT